MIGYLIVAVLIGVVLGSDLTASLIKKGLILL